MKRKFQTLSLLFALFLGGCTASSDQTGNKPQSPLTSNVDLQYAKNFKVTRYDSITLLEIPMPYQGATKGLSYWLIPKGIVTPDSLLNEMVIKTPVNSIVCTSTTHLATLELLEETDKLIGFPSTKYISSNKIRKQVESGMTREVGRDSDLNIEVMLDLSPELLMSYSLTGDYSKLSAIERSGIGIIQNAAFLEESPLGRAEWIKFMALLFNKEHEADSIFNEIVESYQLTLNHVSEKTTHPTVLSGVVYGDIWFMPGGNSWAGKYLNDAGADFLWKDVLETGSLELSFEAVYEKAHDAKLWIGAASFHSLQDLRASDQRYASFDSFADKNVYTYNARQQADGGNDYFESGLSRPDIVLNDLVKIIHPDLLPDYELYYYKRLK